MWIGIGYFVFSTDILTEHHYGIILKLTAAWRNGKQHKPSIKMIVCWEMVNWRHPKCEKYTRDIILSKCLPKFPDSFFKAKYSPKMNQQNFKETDCYENDPTYHQILFMSSILDSIEYQKTGFYFCNYYFYLLDFLE